jgi:hypothetical protein
MLYPADSDVNCRVHPSRLGRSGRRRTGQVADASSGRHPVQLTCDAMAQHGWALPYACGCWLRRFR